MKRSPRRRNPCPPFRTKSCDTSQSCARFCSTAMSSTETCSPTAISSTVRSRISAVTSVSFGRCSKRRRFTVPVTMIWPVSILVTLVIGTKMRLRGCTSTTRPVSLGGLLPLRSTTMASRTLPSWSPLGSNTPIPAKRAKKTRVAVLVVTTEGYRRWRVHSPAAIN